jgi:hypothetical protein
MWPEPLWAVNYDFRFRLLAAARLYSYLPLFQTCASNLGVLVPRKCPREGRPFLPRPPWPANCGCYSQRAVQEGQEERAALRQLRVDIAELVRLVDRHVATV